MSLQGTTLSLTQLTDCDYSISLTCLHVLFNPFEQNTQVVHSEIGCFTYSAKIMPTMWKQDQTSLHRLDRSLC